MYKFSKPEGQELVLVNSGDFQSFRIMKNPYNEISTWHIKSITLQMYAMAMLLPDTDSLLSGSDSVFSPSTTFNKY